MTPVRAVALIAGVALAVAIGVLLLPVSASDVGCGTPLFPDYEEATGRLLGLPFDGDWYNPVGACESAVSTRRWIGGVLGGLAAAVLAFEYLTTRTVAGTVAQQTRPAPR